MHLHFLLYRLILKNSRSWRFPIQSHSFVPCNRPLRFHGLLHRGIGVRKSTFWIRTGTAIRCKIQYQAFYFVQSVFRIGVSGSIIVEKVWGVTSRSQKRLVVSVIRCNEILFLTLPLLFSVWIEWFVFQILLIQFGVSHLSLRLFFAIRGVPNPICPVLLAGFPRTLLCSLFYRVGPRESLIRSFCRIVFLLHFLRPSCCWRLWVLISLVLINWQQYSVWFESFQYREALE